MAGNTFGHYLQATTFGESHGVAVGCVVQGVPAGVPLTAAQLQRWLDRRKPAQNALQSQRKEADHAEIMSGVAQGLTLGTPILVLVTNQDGRAKEYEQLDHDFRPGHADWTWDARYGHRDPRGGGRASARETVARVIAGAIAQAVLDAWSLAHRALPITAIAWSDAIGDVRANGPPPHAITGLACSGWAFAPCTLDHAQIDCSLVRCPDSDASAAMVAAIEAAQLRRDSIGGRVRCVVRNLPAGLGDPVFDKLTATIGHAVLSLPACRGIEFGSGMASAEMAGSQHNDPFVPGSQPLRTATNHHGGTLGGISTGMPLVFDAAFKPAATIAQSQGVADAKGHVRSLAIKGRHDPCVVPRAVPIVEAAAIFCVADALLGLHIARIQE
ncbi:MAG: chorismate synthase [Myxococcales bacterium]|nr:chorismate synthase [Myxococcales bacterium]